MFYEIKTRLKLSDNNNKKPQKLLQEMIDNKCSYTHFFGFEDRNAFTTITGEVGIM